MDYELIFFVSGGVLAASAVILSFLGLKIERFPGRAAPLVALWFVLLVGLSTTFAVLHSQHEEEHREAESGLPQATQEAEEEESE
jgi:multisubunit Na+/H+ antiporter MnhB subunit